MKYDIRDLTKAVQAIHADLIEHDKRGDKMMEAIQRVYQLKKLEERVEAIRSFIREQHHVEIDSAETPLKEKKGSSPLLALDIRGKIDYIWG